MEEINKERYITNSYSPVSIKKIEEILFQMNNSICKIYKRVFVGTGFFCKMKLLNSIYLYVLITNNHVLDENNIKLDSTFSLSIGDNNKIKKIKKTSGRKTYTDKYLDSTFIEINPEQDNIQAQIYGITSQKNSLYTAIEANKRELKAYT